MMKVREIFCAALATLAMVSCSNGGVTLTGTSDVEPEIFPDYKEITIPSNIAPLNFSYLGEEDAALVVEGKNTVQLKAKDGLFSFKPSSWRRIMEENKGGDIALTVAVKEGGAWKGLKPFTIHVAEEDVDPYISYRLLPPGYQAWMRLGIYQRDLESYTQTPIYENKLTDRNCLNCHSYNQRDPGSMLFHVRSQFGGTVMIQDGNVEKLNTKTDSTISALVYPYWHPSGKYVAFSTNITNQNFFNHDPARIEVYDSNSDVVVYDVENHEIAWSPLTKSPDSFETFPTFSPDGRSLYFCTTKSVDSMPIKYRDAHYSLCRIDFNPDDMSFGEKVDTLFNAGDSLSVSFPRISPDGKMLVFTRHGFGNFSIWHKDSDLWAIDLETGETGPMTAVNSDDVDSYHSWSGNSRWLVFSSKRVDGLYARPYLTYIDAQGVAHKPFVIPQKNPLKYYKAQMNSYNIPEFMTGKVSNKMHRIARTLRKSDGTDVKVKQR